jgi:cell division protein FtsZ
MNTDKKTLSRLKKKEINANLFLLGAQRLKGFGSGGDPNIGKEAFNENKSELEKIFVDTDVVFVIAGLGKGTGSGAGPEIAKIAKEKGITTIGIITMPSIRIEGEKTYENAFESKKEFMQNCDSVCTIFNDKIVDQITNSTFFTQLEQGNKEIGSVVNDFVDIISGAGEINIDFNDLKSFLAGNDNIKGNKSFFHLRFNVDDEANSFADLEKLLKDKINSSYSNGDFSTEQINALINFKLGKNNKSDLVVNIKTILTNIASSKNIKVVYGIENILETTSEISIFISTNEITNYTPVKQEENKTAIVEDESFQVFSAKVVDFDNNKTKNISKLLFGFDEEEN